MNIPTRVPDFGGQPSDQPRSHPGCSGWFWRVLVLLALAVVSPAALSQDAAPRPASANRGGELARTACATCHLFPAPDLLDKKTWRDETLPRMKIRIGLSPREMEVHPEGKVIMATGRVLAKPLVSQKEWNQIVDYYVSESPEKAVPQAPRPEIAIGLKSFKVEPALFRFSPPLTTLVQIDPLRRQILLGDERSGSLETLDGRGRRLASVALGNTAVSFGETGNGAYLALIGSFMPSEETLGGIAFLEGSANGWRPPLTLVKDLPRTTHVVAVDLNGDGRLDLVASIFGNNVGRFSWFENKGGGEYLEHVLLPKPGAIRSVCEDFTGDGLPDIAVLVAQETEALYLFTNLGQGRFESRVVFQKHPLFGHTYFEAADFNGDGKKDFLVTNGDNGEYPSPAKNYHGVRIYLNKGDNRFEESYFFPMNGAFKAMARDFDGDGDLDIAAISFFPDYEKSPRECFVYLENKGNLRFVPSTFAECVSGRWLTMDCADLDGDGDVDIVLGSHIRGPGSVPVFLTQQWEKKGPSCLILRNQLR